MSSMVRKTLAPLLLSLAFVPLAVNAQDGAEWDQARAQLRTSQPGDMAQAIQRWKLLTRSDQSGFTEYASFLISFPGFPEEARLRNFAERALVRDDAEPARITAFFDRFAPVTNPARAQYALALAALGRPEAPSMARTAWRGGVMSDAAEAALFAQLAATLTPDDHDARMNALLWAGAAAQAERQILYVSPAARTGFLARLGLVNGKDPASAGLIIGPEALRDAGYVYNRSRMLRTTGQSAAAVSLLATRPPLAAPPFDQRKWIAELLGTARNADTSSAVRIASMIDDAFAPGTDVSRLSFLIRDDYTSLMWLGGSKALRGLGDGARAAGLFYRYGAAARTPQTRSKGFYWAGRAATQAGDAANAARYFELATAYPEQFYGMLSLERLGLPMPRFDAVPAGMATPDERAIFAARPLTSAVREVAREADWPTAVRFFREIADQAVSEGDHLLVADLARDLGRRDLGVILGQSADIDGFGNFQKISFPLMPVIQDGDWTMIHAITRQESQFAMNAVSHAGARGLMQLMPGTAREQAGKLEVAYDSQALVSDAGYNQMLGNAYFARMMDIYGGSYPLAVAAYNCGPGNVNKFLRANGDPRDGSIDWIDWIEQIPLVETRGYVQHVIENAVVYEAMNPEKASYKGANPLSHFLGNRVPG
jgi:soluble lytic murein transglycosylase